MLDVNDCWKRSRKQRDLLLVVVVVVVVGMWFEWVVAEAVVAT